jgi:NDP-sugar pyrophosphorylase family protein
MIIVLPAAGKASRVSGIPKFMLPIVDSNFQSKPIPLINWHLSKLSKLGMKIVIPTSKTYFEMIKVITEEFNPEVIQIDSESMPDSILQTCEHAYSDDYLVIMPDTFFSSYEFVYPLIKSRNDLTLATWKYRESQRGKFGSVEIDDLKNEVLKVVDKDPNSPLDAFWGSAKMSRDLLPHLSKHDTHLGHAFNRYLFQGKKVHNLEVEGEYFDIGTFDEYFNLITSFERADRNYVENT